MEMFLSCCVLAYNSTTSHGPSLPSHPPPIVTASRPNSHISFFFFFFFLILQFFLSAWLRFLKTQYICSGGKELFETRTHGNRMKN